MGEANELLAEMEKGSIDHNNGTNKILSSNIISLVQNGKVEIASEFFEIAKHSMKPSPQIYSSLISSHAKKGNFKKAKQYLQELTSSFGKEDFASGYKSILDEYFRSQKFQEAKELLAEMEK